MSSRLNEFLKSAGLFILTIGVAVAGFYIVMYSEQKAQDYDSAQLKAQCEAMVLGTSGIYQCTLVNGPEHPEQKRTKSLSGERR